MTLSPEDYYKIHTKNLHAVQDGFLQIERQLRLCIVKNDHKSSIALLNTLLLITGSWAECRLLKLLFEPNGFKLQDRNEITSAPRQIDRWKKSLELGFRKKYNIRHNNLVDNLPITPRLRYIEMLNSIETEIKPIIEIRNTMAHGQWSIALNSNNSSVSSERMNIIKNENALSIKFKKSIINYLCYIFHDLVSGGIAFERDFDRNYSNLENARRNLKLRKYQEWENRMKEKYEKGKISRNLNINKNS